MADSIHRESGLGLEGSVILTPSSGFSLEGSLGHFENEGSYPFTITRARLTGEVPISREVGLVAEWMRDKYSDAAQGLGGLGRFAANRYGVYVHWHPLEKRPEAWPARRAPDLDFPGESG